MRPLAIFGAVVVVGVVLIAAGLRLTDHPASATPPPRTASPTPLSHAQFVRAANAICRRGNRKGNAIFKKKAKSLTMIARQVRIAVPLFDSEAAALRALAPPSRDAAAWRRLLNHLGQDERQLHAIRHAFETRQWIRGAAIARQLDVTGKRDDPALKRLGLTVCAKD